LFENVNTRIGQKYYIYPTETVGLTENTLEGLEIKNLGLNQNINLTESLLIRSFSFAF
jgi:hypothetical protein